jgi:transposase
MPTTSRTCRVASLPSGLTRGTDVKDCEWISDLARHGLIANSFVPPRAIRDLRDLTRYRRKLVQAQAAERNRLIKLLESAGIKLSGVISDVFGVSGRAMLRAPIEVDQSPAEMARLAQRRMKRKQPEIARALDGHIDEHHRFILRLQLQRITAAEAGLVQLDERLSEKLAPYDEELGRLMQIPGVDWVTAGAMIAEIGVDMSVFHGAAHLAAWAGLCPDNHESAGRQRSGKTRKGNVWLKTATVTPAIAAAKARRSDYAEKFRRLSSRRGKMRAAVAIALVAAYHMLANRSDYRELGPDYLDRLHHHRTAINLTNRLRAMGFDVQITAKAA